MWMVREGMKSQGRKIKINKKKHQTFYKKLYFHEAQLGKHSLIPKYQQGKKCSKIKNNE